MMHPGRGGWGLAGVIAGSAVLLAGLYVGAYFATVRTSYIGWDPDYQAVPAYPRPWMTWLFDPIHQLDRGWLRPKEWGPPP